MTHRARTVAVLTVCLCAFSLAGFLGRWHWALDLLSHFRPQYAVALIVASIVCAVMAVPRMVLLVALGCLSVQLGALVPFWLAPSLEGSVGGGSDSVSVSSTGGRVLLANVYTGNRNFTAVADLIRQENPDVVVLQETDAAWLAGLAEVRAYYPHHVERPRPDNFGIAVWSRTALHDVEVVAFDDAGVPSVVAGVTWGGRTFTLIATHPLPPAGGRRARLRNDGLRAVAERAAVAVRPVLVVGDLNCTPWSPHFRDLLARGRLRDSAEGRGLHATWPSHLGPFGIPIDHVLLGDGLRVRARRVGPQVGSDHRPLIVDVAFAAGS